MDQGSIVDRATNWELQLDWRDATNPKRRRRRERYKTSENRSVVKRKGSSQWIRTSAYSADGVADRLVGGAADGLAEVDIAADWDLADGDRLKIALRVGEIAGEREDGICLSGENEGHDVKILGENG